MLKDGISKLLAGVALGIIASFIFVGAGNSDRNSTKIIDRLVRDTVVKYITPEPIEIIKTKLKIEKIRDTIIRFVPFTASLDTIVKNDTIQVKYQYPENIFSMAMNFSPDTLESYNTRLYFHEPKHKPWWELPAQIASSVGAGVVIGLLIK
jgi:hypothetical protein